VSSDVDASNQFRDAMFALMLVVQVGLHESEHSLSFSGDVAVHKDLFNCPGRSTSRQEPLEVFVTQHRSAQ
jgi:hypothetical protein